MDGRRGVVNFFYSMIKITNMKNSNNSAATASATTTTTTIFCRYHQHSHHSNHAIDRYCGERQDFVGHQQRTNKRTKGRMNEGYVQVMID
mmetsp:Transcript_28620/g.69520  ORF Transcript_28620/g.69520 Transcript_28620/m.69520 type:complete len:90 (-) Transcript_28620:276-545(-)